MSCYSLLSPLAALSTDLNIQRRTKSMTDTPPAANGASHDPQSDHLNDNDEDSGSGKRKRGPKRRKVNHACLYCRRSHSRSNGYSWVAQLMMTIVTCDEGRPCQRW